MIKLNMLENYKIFDGEKLLNIRPTDEQGDCNTTYILSTLKCKYIIKKITSHIYVSKNHEFSIQSITHNKSISPQALLLDAKKSLLVQEYIKGVHKFELSKKDIKNLAFLLNKLHKIKIKTKIFDMSKYFHSATKDKELKLVLQDLKNYKQDLVLCHNDLNPKNILFGSKIKILDWEYACINDRYFDLASVCIEFKLSRREERNFMRYYFKNKMPNFKKLHTFKILYKYVCYTWQKNIKDLTCQE